MYDPNRHTRAQKIYWNSDGTPNFGIPVPDGPLPLRFRSYSVQTYYIRHDEDRVILDSDMRNVADSQFRVVPGLADPDAISLESVDIPGSYLRHRDGEIWLDVNDGSTSFAADATWWQQPGLTDSNGISFESYNIPGQYIRQRDNLLYLSPITTSMDNADATFLEER